MVFTVVQCIIVQESTLCPVWWHCCSVVAVHTSVVAVHTSVVAAVVERGALLARRRHHSPLWVLDPPRSADLGSGNGVDMGLWELA